ncbi:MAG: hypothetical protein HN758_14105 [Verrucomicrobia bacterium]|nr:hypothetical protein [Verrucomicrobiota bacterium]MBT4276644.1 hypothetical protein [Verrucomicrobiota bacterium]MBT5061017.1 hypothetical protein [Verrucomicrobiota bacterium]MBT5478362.1 hypothetical protein [Verrucomicrobiota bacterium]MBT6806402.1 hypothetical protein [Verrucomicrobiota bacterium]
MRVWRWPACLLSSAVVSNVNLTAIESARGIQPDFDALCLEYHGPNKQKSDLRIDRRAVLMKGGSSGISSISPGNPLKSYLLDLI